VPAASPNRPLMLELQALCRDAANRRLVPRTDSCTATNSTLLFNHLVGAGEQWKKDRWTECLLIRPLATANSRELGCYWLGSCLCGNPHRQ
jgi:hypothetical protein